jgi:hypothetical protein
MKKILMFFLSILLLVIPLLSGCTTDNYIYETTTYTKTVVSANTVTVITTTTATKTVTEQNSVVTTSSTTSETSSTASTSTQTAVTSYLLSEALAQGLITVNVNGYAGTTFGGVSSGDILIISFLRQVPQTIKIIVPLGTTLINNDSVEQNMVILKLKGRDPSIVGYYPEDEITLNKDEWQEYLFEAYCTDMSKSNIWNSTTFSIGQLATQNIIAMLTIAQEIGPEIATIPAIQVALWALTDNPSLEELQDRFNADEQTINNAWTILWESGLNPGSLELFSDYTPR